ncbi:MAG: hypothetical protein KJZ74_14740 [Gemmatimonadales bacterium]|nr:hypothetical protein [Gemmatimonadales bacterium]
MKRRTAVPTLALLWGALLLAAPTVRAQAPAITPLVTTEWLQAELARPDLVILQIGTAADFARAHVPGAVAIDFAGELVAPPVEGGLRTELPEPASLEAVLRAKGVRESSRVVLVFDQSNAFTRAGRAFFTLEWAGLAGRVAVLDGGLPKWVREGRQVSTGPGRIVAPSTIALRPEFGRRATKDDVRAMVGASGARIVDARDTVFYQDLRDNGMPRGGHVASAVNIPYNLGTNADGTLRPREELERLVAAAGIGDGDKLVSYCHIGMQASWMYFTLRVLGRDVRMFDGSFDEWSRDPSLPVEGARPRP